MNWVTVRNIKSRARLKFWIRVKARNTWHEKLKWFFTTGIYLQSQISFFSKYASRKFRSGSFLALYLVLWESSKRLNLADSPTDSWEETVSYCHTWFGESCDDIFLEKMIERLVVEIRSPDKVMPSGPPITFCRRGDDLEKQSLRFRKYHTAINTYVPRFWIYSDLQ